MTDLLTHVLAAYAVATVASWLVDGFEPRHVALAMVGGALPDAAKIHLLIDGFRTTVGGVTVSWLALQTVGAALTLALAGTVLVPGSERRRAFAALAGGVCLHVALDYLVVRAGGRSPPYLYPLTWAQFPSVDVYLSSDVWPGVVAVAVAAAVWFVDRRRRRRVTGGR